jgi:hypothetical protein
MSVNQPDGAKLDAPIEVQGTKAGQLSDGDSFDVGTPIADVLRAMLQDPQQGTLSLSGSGAQAREMGASINETLTATAEQNESGDVQAVRINSGDVTPSPYELAVSFQIGTQADVRAAATQNAEADFAASDDFSALTATAAFSYLGRRFVFFDTNADPTTSSEVRALAGSILNAKDGLTFDIDVQDGDTSVAFGYPKALGTVEKIEFQGALTSDVTNDYNRNTVSVNGAPDNGNYAIDYYVYRREPADPYDNVTIEVTI